MGRVRVLDDNTANQIAAGEVVERPASVVKELVENAIDAGARQIRVVLEEGGKHRVRVQDDGCGMLRDDAVLSLHRHATSKICSAEDLFAVRTLGFRGEALPSIASVSRFEMWTKAGEEPIGTRILVVGGVVELVEDVATPDGTVVEVSHLFFNTPARLKFLKSTPTELARALDIVGHLAVAYPGIAFRVLHGEHEVFATPGTGEVLASLAAVWGRDVARRLIPMEYCVPGLVVKGYVATPDMSRPGRSHELFFVNRRPVRSRLLCHAVEEAVRSLTPEGRYPVAAVFVEVDPGMVDVNVHPTKVEVKFTHDSDVHHAVTRAVKTALLDYGIVPVAQPVAVPISDSGRPDADLLSTGEDRGTQTASDRATYMPEAVVTDPLGSLLTAGSPAEEAIVPPARPRPFAEQLRAFRVLGQIQNTYIVASTEQGIAVIDQHVAHERVLYERLTVARNSNGIPSQRLVVPLTLHLGRREAVLLEQHCADFAAAGWDIAPFGGESFVVRAVPALIAQKPYEQILRDMIDELVHQAVSRRLLVQREHVTITNACRMAVKAGDPLTIEEMEGLLHQLAETENPYLCPHGRPIVVTISLRDLDRLFKRA
ncbi:MAG: DNA mismatch repair endonuclease MutL [Chthonomonadaceae bacterium]|nr:DNA mismatch repair endonuclease MutL [Chthonomonadaceae bacterium]